MSGTSVKKIYLIRHAQSRWNKAQKHHNLLAMVKERDHPLTSAGYRQAHALALEIEAASRGDGSFGSLLDASAVWCSPHTRALQTTLVGLHPLLEGGQLRVCLKPSARERKSLGGFDSVGAGRGDQCVHRALRKLYGIVDACEVERLRTVRVDTDEAQEKWWSCTRDSRASVRSRINKLLLDIQSSPHCSIIIVGHSHFFRELFRSCACKSEEAALGLQLRNDKIPNCGVASCTISFSPDTCTLTSVRLAVPARNVEPGMEPRMRKSQRRAPRSATVVPT